MLAGLIVAYPHPSAISCSAAGGSPGGGGPPARAGTPRPPNGEGSPNSASGRPPNIIITGTGPFASAGSTSVIWISTVSAGYAELSTRPASNFPTTARPPTDAFTVLVTSQVTLGAFFGTRPSTSRSKSSTISGRRSRHHISAVVTLRPFFSVSASGRSGNGLAFASS